MHFCNRTTLKLTFTTFCIIGLLCMAIFWLYKYAIEDRDIGIVDYMRSKETLEFSHPVVSLCFRKSFVSQEMVELGMIMNPTTYLDYLKGDTAQEIFDELDFTNITLNFE